MTFEQAYERVAMAGREMGSGPRVAAERITADEPIEDWLKGQGCPPTNAGCIMLGVAIGLVMCRNSDAMRTLNTINDEWLRDALDDDRGDAKD